MPNNWDHFPPLQVSCGAAQGLDARAASAWKKTCPAEKLVSVGMGIHDMCWTSDILLVKERHPFPRGGGILFFFNFDTIVGLKSYQTTRMILCTLN